MSNLWRPVIRYGGGGGGGGRFGMEILHAWIPLINIVLRPRKHNHSGFFFLFRISFIFSLLFGRGPDRNRDSTTIVGFPARQQQRVRRNVQDKLTGQSAQSTIENVYLILEKKLSTRRNALKLYCSRTVVYLHGLYR